LHNRLRSKLSGIVLVAIVVAACGGAGATTTTTQPATTLPGGETTLAPAPPDPELLVTEGTASLNGEPVERNSSVQLSPGDNVTVEGLAKGLIRIPESFSLEVFKNGSVTLQAWDDQQITALLSAGHVRFELLDQAETQLHLETASGSIIETLGGHALFTVCEPPNGSTCLAVEEGRVKLEAGGESTTYERNEGTSTKGAFLVGEAKTPSEELCIPDQEFATWLDQALHVEGSTPLGAFVATYPPCDVTTERITKEVAVPAIEVWTDSGVDVASGDLLILTATGEVWHGRSKKLFGPEGNSNPEVRELNVIEGTNHAALIGRIGENGTPFVVGTEYGKPVDEGGRLFLGINDTGVEDNGGQFDVVVIVVS
jgi:hypothetical protein